LTFDKYPVAFAANCAEVDEDVVTAVSRNEAEPLRGVEPLDRAGFTAGSWRWRISGLGLATARGAAAIA